MTNDSFSADDALEWHLLTKYAALCTDLTDTLDIGAGLREVLIPAQHRTLVTDLGATLDLESGLSAIVPEARPGPALRPDPVIDALRDGSVVGYLKALSLSARWLLRTAMLTTGLEVAYETADRLAVVCGNAYPISPDQEPEDYSDQWVDICLPMFHRWHRSISAAVHSAEVVHELFPAETRDQGAPFRALIGRWRGLTEMAYDVRRQAVVLGEQYERGARDRPELVSEVTEALGGVVFMQARELAATINALNDFVADDLRESGLQKIHLDGLRWSKATSFPPDWLDEIDRDSVHIGNGVFEVQQGNTRTLV